MEELQSNRQKNCVESDEAEKAKEGDDDRSKKQKKIKKKTRRENGYEEDAWQLKISDSLATLAKDISQASKGIWSWRFEQKEELGKKKKMLIVLELQELRSTMIQVVETEHTEGEEASKECW